MFVKICGITHEDDALFAVAMGADALGFIFAPSSRQITPERGGEIARRLPAEVLTVGVFRNEAPERVLQIMNRTGLRVAQLHGMETVEETQWLAERVPVVIKAFSAESADLARAADWGTEPILVDAPKPGSGEVFDWSLVRRAPHGLRVLLAGGLGPDNVAEAIRTVRPWGVDVSSGVERSPGRKDALAVKHFIENARAAGVALGGDPSPRSALDGPARGESHPASDD